MNKIVLAPDSFKGTLSATHVCAIMHGRILHHFPACEVISLPVADGGEGTVDCFLQASGGERVTCNVTGPFGEPVESFYAVLPGGTAVIEMAAAAGLPMAGGHENPGAATTFGVGQLMCHAVARGCRHLLVGLGGSCTNDLGAGAASAAGAHFTDKDGIRFVPTGATLGRIAAIQTNELADRFSGVRITAMCDIDNPLYGPAGAARVFAPQKGAGPAMVEMLDANLRHAAGVIEKTLARPVSNLPGAGAAGGMGAGLCAFFGATLQSGIDTVLDTIGFDEKTTGAGIIFTGEGRLDTQSLRGKAVAGVAGRAARQNIPVVVFCGEIGDGIDAVYGHGVTAVFSINRKAVDFSVSRFHSGTNLALAVDNVLRLIKATTA